MFIITFFLFFDEVFIITFPCQRKEDRIFTIFTSPLFKERSNLVPTWINNKNRILWSSFFLSLHLLSCHPSRSRNIYLSASLFSSVSWFSLLPSWILSASSLISVSNSYLLLRRRNEETTTCATILTENGFVADNVTWTEPLMEKSVGFWILGFVVWIMEEKILVSDNGDGNHTVAIFHGMLSYSLCNLVPLELKVSIGLD